MHPSRQLLATGMLIGLVMMAPQALAAESSSSAPESTLVAPVTPKALLPETTPTTKSRFSLSTQQEVLKITNDIETARRQVQERPDDPEAHFLLSAALSRSPYLEEAFRELKRTKEMLKAKKDFEFIDRTITSYEGLLQSRSDDTVVMFRLALGYFLKGYSLEKYPHHYKNGPTGTNTEFYGKAEQTFRRIITLDPQDIWARNALGYVLSDNGRDLAKAIETWEESLRINSDSNPGAYLLLSEAYLRQGDLQRALTYGAKGLAIKQAMGMTLP